MKPKTRRELRQNQMSWWSTYRTTTASTSRMFFTEGEKVSSGFAECQAFRKPLKVGCFQLPRNTIHSYRNLYVLTRLSAEPNSQSLISLALSYVLKDTVESLKFSFPTLRSLTVAQESCIPSCPSYIWNMVRPSFIIKLAQRFSNTWSDARVGLISYSLLQNLMCKLSTNKADTENYMSSDITIRVTFQLHL